MTQRLPATVARDETIVEMMLTRQASAEELAARYGLSRSRIYQIVSLHAGRDVPDNTTLDIHVLRLEKLYFECERIALGPPTYKVGATGVIIFEDEPVVDNTEKLMAATTAMRIDESIRKLMARDQPRRKTMPHDEAMARVREYLAKLPAAEVVPDGGQGSGYVLPSSG